MQRGILDLAHRDTGQGFSKFYYEHKNTLQQAAAGMAACRLLKRLIL